MTEAGVCEYTPWEPRMERIPGPYEQQITDFFQLFTPSLQLVTCMTGMTGINSQGLEI